MKNSRKFFSDYFKNSSATHPVFLLLVRGHHAQKGGQPPMKRYNTPHRSRVVKTRLTDEEYADFTARLAPYGMSQSEFIRQAITRATIRPIVTVSPVNDEWFPAFQFLLNSIFQFLSVRFLCRCSHKSISDLYRYLSHKNRDNSATRIRA